MLLKSARAWLRATPSWAEADQEEAVREFCAERGWRVVIYRASEISRADFIRALRETDVAVIPRLDLLVPVKVKGRPTHDLTLAHDEIKDRAGLVAEVNTGATSADKASWKRALAASLVRVSSGRRSLDRRQAQIMAQRSAAVRSPRGLVTQWTDDNPTARARRERWDAVWKSVKFATWEEARAALPEELRTVSQATLRRIFGRRK